jgi:hypothetical protein
LKINQITKIPSTKRSYLSRQGFMEKGANSPAMAIDVGENGGTFPLFI